MAKTAAKKKAAKKSAVKPAKKSASRKAAKPAPRKAAKAVAKASPTQAVKAWLKRFDAALTAGDVDAAVKLFGAESFWRDLVSFTWNIKTSEGQQQIADMLKATLKKVKPSNWQIEGEASEGGGLQEAWFTFETKVARGRGHLRLKDGKGWTLLTTMVELKGHEEPSGEKRPHGRRARRLQGPQELGRAPRRGTGEARL